MSGTGKFVARKIHSADLEGTSVSIKEGINL